MLSDRLFISLQGRSIYFKFTPSVFVNEMPINQIFCLSSLTIYNYSFFKILSKPL